MNKDTFGRKLKRYRLDRGWTLRQLSTVTGYPEGTLSRIENNKVRPHEVTMAKIVREIPSLLDDRDAKSA